MSRKESQANSINRMILQELQMIHQVMLRIEKKISHSCDDDRGVFCDQYSLKQEIEENVNEMNLSDESNNLQYQVDESANIHVNIPFCKDKNLPIEKEITEVHVAVNDYQADDVECSTVVFENDSCEAPLVDNDIDLNTEFTNEWSSREEVISEQACDLLQDHDEEKACVVTLWENLHNNEIGNSKLASKKAKIKHFKTPRFSCKLCLKAYTRKSSLTRHLETHLKTKKLQCEFCLKYFSRTSSLANHIIMSHSDGTLTSLNKKSKFKASQHNSVIDSALANINCGSFRCEVCSKVYSSMAACQRHFRVHSGKKKFTCHLCAKSFFRKDYLNYHLENRCPKRQR